MSVILREAQYKKIIEKLVKLRIEKGLTQADIAQILETNQSRISRIENCETQIDILQLNDFARLYNVKIEDLY